MGAMAITAVIALALLIGLCSQLVGRPRTSYEWAMGTVGALYGELLFSGLFGAAPAGGLAFDGLPVITSLLGGLIFGGAFVLALREFGSPILKARRPTAAPALPVYTRTVRLRVSADLFQDPMPYAMHKRFGVATSLRRAEVSAGRGWIDLDVSGSEPAVKAALDIAQQNRLLVEAPTEVVTRALVAA